MNINSKGTLHFFCGKMTASKSTRAAKLAIEYNAILLSEDEWLKTLYPDEIKVFEDYLRYAARLRPLLFDLVTDLLSKGMSVIMDFPANTREQRNWFKNLFSTHNFPHLLHYLDVDDEQCIQQLKIRSARLPDGAAFTTEAEFHHVNSYFQPPAEEEGYTIRVYMSDSS